MSPAEPAAVQAPIAQASTAADPPLLHVQWVTLRYRSGGRTVTAVEEIDIRVARGERLAVVGPSGCGKSSLLGAIAGFLTPESGRITIAGRPVAGPGPDRAVVFQELDQLLPWKTVRENVAFALRTARGLGAREAHAAAESALARVRLLDRADAYPHTLSGGMKQRVAIARCLALRPALVLMDEPFASLDALSRRRMQDELLALWDDGSPTLVFVTHAIDEAVRIGTRIVLLSPHPGRVRADLSVGREGRCEGPDAAALARRVHELLHADGGDWCI
ncbi:MAG TPA: ABC transporter ATP-binding protein [Anaeromyxobacter sp.]